MDSWINYGSGATGMWGDTPMGEGKGIIRHRLIIVNFNFKTNRGG